MPFQKGYKRAPTSGRKPGVLNKNTAEIKTLAMKDVPRVVHELVRLALHAKNEATRVAACKELLDRAIGKAIQPRAGESGEGPVIVQVVTGVPRSGELTNAAFSSVMPANPFDRQLGTDVSYGQPLSSVPSAAALAGHGAQ
jgi:hypothetical protein